MVAAVVVSQALGDGGVVCVKIMGGQGLRMGVRRERGGSSCEPLS